MGFFSQLDGLAELWEYTLNLPDFESSEIKEVAIRIWENRKENEQKQEEFGAFQVYGRFVNIFLGEEMARELELQLNDELEQEGFPIKLSIRQINISGMPTQTFEIIILDNSDYEAVDPILTRLIEEQTFLENR